MKVVIIGGGTVGWITTLYLSSIKNGNEYINISSEEIPIIGVGEGTTGRFVHEFSKNHYNINPTEMMYSINALPKLGIKFRNWSDTNQEFYSPIDGTYTHDFYIDYCSYVCQSSQFTKLMKMNKTNYILDNEELKYNIDGHALHIDAYKTSEYFRDKSIQNGVKHLKGTVKKVNQDSKIKSITLDDGTEITGDLFIDCSGFSRILSQDSGWEDYSQYLPVNRAITFKSSDDTKNEYTVAEAMNHGWTWEIPTREKVGRGYVYCDSFATQDDIVQELETRHGDVEIGRLISFDSGRIVKFVNKNCVSIGLSSGFLEPLQATSIHCALVQLELFVSEFLHDISLMDNQYLIDSYNHMIGKVYDDMRDFVSLHYTGGKSDSDFWKHCSHMKTPQRVDQILYLCNTRLLRSYDFDFLVGTVKQESWNPILSGLNHFPKDIIDSVLKGDGTSVEWWKDNISQLDKETEVIAKDNLSSNELNQLLLSL